MRVWLLLVVATGCGGAPFTIGVDAVPLEGSAPTSDGGLLELKRDAGRSSVREDAVGPEVQDGSPEAADAREAASEAADAQDAAPDAGEVRDAATEAGDARPDVATGVDASTTCTPIVPVMTQIGGCGGNYATGITFSVPSQFCLYILGPTDHWSAAVTPEACRCAETYNCACVLSELSPCPAKTLLVACNEPPRSQPGIGLGVQCR
jgi:hypothetical protein